MNPNETNPTTPTGASGAAGGASGTTSSSPIPAPLDLTGTSSSGLSMADSLASAQDNLTSAGQAANFTSNTLGMDQLGADSPSATMEMPNQPLTPAAPVPGSIGSVTSVPPLKTADTTSSFGAATPTTSAMPVMGGGNSASTATAGSATPATNSSYYNPFAAPAASSAAATAPAGTSVPNVPSPSSAMPTSSTAVPPALQPQTEKFSDRLKTPKAAKGTTNMKGIVMIIGWALALVATVLAVFFFIQWQGAEKRANEKEIVYIPSPEPGADEGDDEVAVITCKKDLGGEGTEGLENAINHSQTAIITYFNEQENHNLNFAMLTDDFSFTDNGAAEAARGRFDERAAGLIGIAEGMGIAPLESNIEIADNVLHYTVSGAADRLIGEHANMLLVPVSEDGVAQTDPDSMKASYEANGFACTVE